MRKLLFLLILSQVTISDAGFWSNVRMRARESFQDLQFERQGQKENYRGFTNTFNLWYEKPFQHSVGLAGGSVLGSLKRQGEQNLIGFGKSVQIDFVGAEWKAFVYSTNKQGVYLRSGLYWQNLKTKGTASDQPGSGYLFGAGYEFLVYKSMSLSPEVAFRAGETKNYRWTGYSISLGVHFYKF